MIFSSIHISNKFVSIKREDDESRGYCRLKGWWNSSGELNREIDRVSMNNNELNREIDWEMGRVSTSSEKIRGDIGRVSLDNE